MAREGTRDQDSKGDVRSQLLHLLLEKIHEDTYPSVTMLDFVEELLTPDEVPVYAGVLLSKIDGDIYPSTSMIQRVMGLV